MVVPGDGRPQRFCTELALCNLARVNSGPTEGPLATSAKRRIAEVLDRAHPRVQTRTQVGGGFACPRRRTGKGKNMQIIQVKINHNSLIYLFIINFILATLGIFL